MWGYKVKIRKADKLFSEYIRIKANWKCEYCKRDFSNKRHSLTAAHYFGRRKESVRFDSDNVSAICAGCHFKFHEDKNLHKEFMLTKLGQEGFDRLTLRANILQKKDDKITILRIKQMLKGLKCS